MAVEARIYYGAGIKLSRQNLGIKKTHANDAYAIGKLHPKHRANTRYYEKRRHDNRILGKFMDATYRDAMNSNIKKGM